MKFVATPVKDVFVVELEQFSDDRGYFARAWCAREFADQGLEANLVQVNLSGNKKAGTLRGLHYQISPYDETKLVRCISGALFDQVIDLRKDSPTYGRSFGVELNPENKKMLYVPAGFAHGYQTLQDDTEALYQVSEFYTPGAEQGVRYNDPRFALEWPLPVSNVSEKDAQWPDYQD